MKKLKVLEVLKEIINNFEKGVTEINDYYVKCPDSKNFYLIDEIDLFNSRISYDDNLGDMYFDKDTEVYKLEENDN